MWMNGMMHEENPLANMQLDEDSNDLGYYGYDSQGPSPLEDNGEVVVPEIRLDHSEEFKSFVLQNLNPLSPLNSMAVDIYMNALQLVKTKIDELNAAML